MAVPWPSGRLWDSQSLSQSRPDAHGTANYCPKAIRTPMGQSISLPKAIRTPVGRHVTHLGQLWMAMGMRTGMGRTPLGLNRPLGVTSIARVLSRQSCIHHVCGGGWLFRGMAACMLANTHTCVWAVPRSPCGHDQNRLSDSLHHS